MRGRTTGVEPSVPIIVEHPANTIGLERALTTWLLGDAPAAMPFGACSGIIEDEEGVGCVVTLDDDTTYGTAATRPLVGMFVRAAHQSKPHRAYGTVRDASWAWLAGSDVAWIAAEPAGDQAMLLAVGTTDDARDNILPRLPKLARICSVVLARERAKQMARETRHDLKNLVAAVKGNIELARELLQRGGDPGNLERAIENVSEATRRLEVTIAEKL